MTPTLNKNLLIRGAVLFIASILVAYFAVTSFGAPDSNSAVEDVKVFVVAQDSSKGDIVHQLKETGLIKSRIAFYLIYRGDISHGGYLLSKGMTVRQLARTLKNSPELVWVTIPEGLRKEQIADILTEKLGWSEEQEKKWVTNYTAMTLDTIEGVYFPDTYLIPLSDTPFQVSERLRYRFNEVFAPLAKQALEKNIKWTTVVKIASLVQREAAGKSDMPLIAGIIWNRLDKGMRLEIDATVQYAVDTYQTYNVNEQAWELTYHGQAKPRGDWWKPITPADKKIVSAVNTYTNKGLPSRPISNPGMDALQAALFPQETKCLYYLHDSEGNIHCAVTYEEHLANIEKYL